MVANDLGSNGDFISETASSTIATIIASSTLESALASTTADKISSTPSFIQAIANAVQITIESMSNWVVDKFTAKVAYVTRVEANTVAISNGLEMTDQATGQIFCVVIRNGDWSKQQGPCSTTEATTTDATSTTENNQQPTTIDQQPTPTPSPTPTISEQQSATTTQATSTTEKNQAPNTPTSLATSTSYVGQSNDQTSTSTTSNETASSTVNSSGTPNSSATSTDNQSSYQ